MARNQRIRITYADKTTEVVDLAEAAFGLEGTALHGPVVRATLAEREDTSPDEAFPNHTRLSRSLSGLPIYGTGRVRP